MSQRERSISKSSLTGSIAVLSVAHTAKFRGEVKKRNDLSPSISVSPVT